MPPLIVGGRHGGRFVQGSDRAELTKLACRHLGRKAPQGPNSAADRGHRGSLVSQKGHASVGRDDRPGSASVFLKTLTLKGFKSFADVTTLEMEPGVTVVVGPNGSGKS